MHKINYSTEICASDTIFQSEPKEQLDTSYTSITINHNHPLI